MSRISYTYSDLGKLLGQRVPGVRKRLAEELEWWKDEPPPIHVLYGDVLHPYFEQVILLGSPQEITEIADFLEELARHPDSQVRDVVRVSVLKPLCSSAELLEQVRSRLGPRTRELLREIENWQP